MTEKLIGSGLLVITLIAFFFALNYALNQTEQQECRDWRQSATARRITPNYANWQVAQCEHHNIPLSPEN